MAYQIIDFDEYFNDYLTQWMEKNASRFANADEMEEAAPEDIAYAKAYLGLNQEEGYVWGLIRGCMSSASRLCVIQMQDYMELGKEGRMNHPGTLSNRNWTWRAKPGFASKALAARILETTRLYDRT